jgi:hypothetical protein
MAVSRRNFLAAGRSLLAAAALPMKFFGAAAGPDLASSRSANLASSTRETFLPLVNGSFAVRSGALTTAWLTLLSVQDMNLKSPARTALAPKAANTPTTDTFALHFQGTGETLLQDTYELEHDSFGKFSLFLVPSGPASYTAIISHIQGATPIRAPRPVNSKACRGAPTKLENV